MLQRYSSLTRWSIGCSRLVLSTSRRALQYAFEAGLVHQTGYSTLIRLATIDRQLATDRILGGKTGAGSGQTCMNTNQRYVSITGRRGSYAGINCGRGERAMYNRPMRCSWKWMARALIYFYRRFGCSFVSFALRPPEQRLFGYTWCCRLLQQIFRTRKYAVAN